MSQLKASSVKLPCRPRGRELVEHFGAVTTRKLVDVVEMAIESLYARDGIPLPPHLSKSQRRRRPAHA